MSKKAFYAVRRGNKTGIFTSWEETKPLVLGVPGAVYKGFITRSEAEAWFQGKTAPMAVTLAPKRLHVKLKTTTQGRRRIPPAGSIIAFCDGACPGNGKPDARAGVGIFFGPNDPRNYSGRLSPQTYRQTNQVAEIMAAIMTIERSDPAQPLSIFTDSIYVVNAMNSWRFNWKCKNWNAKLTNLEHFRRLSDLVDARPHGVYFTHVKGHSTSIGNIAADRLATEGAQKEA